MSHLLLLCHTAWVITNGLRYLHLWKLYLNYQMYLGCIQVVHSVHSISPSLTTLPWPRWRMSWDQGKMWRRIHKNVSIGHWEENPTVFTLHNYATADFIDVDLPSETALFLRLPHVFILFHAGCKNLNNTVINVTLLWLYYQDWDWFEK